MGKPHGFLNVLKPAGISSHHCVVKVRKMLKTRQVGHAGTLDPMATGVLTMALGDATRFLQYLSSEKEYIGAVRFGVTTDSDDVTGKILTERPAPWLAESEAKAALERFVGSIDQVPPRVSAIRKNGVRMYELARANTEIEVAPRRVHIGKIDLLEFTAGLYPEARIHVECGGGTYIRSIARECGEVLAIPPSHVDGSCQLQNSRGEFCVGGTLAALERTRNGAFSLSDSVGLDDLQLMVHSQQSPLQSIESALLHLPRVALPAMAAHRWEIGGIVHIAQQDAVDDSCAATPLLDGSAVRVYDELEGHMRFRGVSRVEKQPIGSCFILRKRTFA